MYFLFTSSLVRTSKVHGLYSLMIAHRSYKYKATSSHSDPTTGGAGSILGLCGVIKGQRTPAGYGHQCLPHPSVQPCIPASLHLSTAPSWPHSRSPSQVCLQGYVRKQNISTRPVCARTVGTFFSHYSVHCKTFPSLF